MAALSLHIVLLCIAIDFFVTTEGFSIIQDASASRKRFGNNNNRWSKHIAQNLKQDKQREGNPPNKIIAVLMPKKHTNDQKRRRNPMNNFLQKLNTFINKHSKNNVYDKRDACSFGFGNPRSKKCKREKQSLFGWSKSVVVAFPENTGNYRRNQHMLVEPVRARASDSGSDSSSELSSDSFSEERVPKHKSHRFKIVDNINKKKSKTKVISESEASDYDTTDYSDSSEYSDYPAKNKHPIKYSDYPAKNKHPNKYSEYPVKNKHPKKKFDENVDKEPSHSDNDKSDEPNEPKDSKYMYLQGTRLLRPRAKTRRDDTRSRIPHFMPKRYHWDSDAIHDLDTFWLHGIRPKKHNNY